MASLGTHKRRSTTVLLCIHEVPFASRRAQQRSVHTVGRLPALSFQAPLEVYLQIFPSSLRRSMRVRKDERHTNESVWVMIFALRAPSFMTLPRMFDGMHSSTDNHQRSTA